jgi:hypothetical protein
MKLSSFYFIHPFYLISHILSIFGNCHYELELSKKIDILKEIQYASM